MFPDNETAEQWFVETRWPDGITCAYCDSENVNDNATHKTMPYRCNTCKKRFLGQNQFADARVKHILPEMGYCGLPGHDFAQRAYRA